MNMKRTMCMILAFVLVFTLIVGCLVPLTGDVDHSDHDHDEEVVTNEVMPTNNLLPDSSVDDILSH